MATPSGSMRGGFSTSPPPVMCAGPRRTPARCRRRSARAWVAGGEGRAAGGPGEAGAGAELGRARVEGEAHALEQHLLRERVAVRVQPARSQAQQPVPRPDRGAVDEAALLHHADAEAGEVVLAVGVEAG